jgi:hypothetical protein
MSARRLACVGALALLPVLVAAGPPARAAGMPAEGTKNFTPGPATPSYFTGERGLPEAGPSARRDIGGPGYPAAAASARRAPYARPARPAKEAAPRRFWTRPPRAQDGRNRAERARLARLRALRLARLRRRARARRR